MSRGLLRNWQFYYAAVLQLHELILSRQKRPVCHS